MEIGGRAFQVADLERRTVRHDARIKAVLSKVGLFDAARETGNSAEQFAASLYRIIVEQEAAVPIAALFLLPEPVELRTWTPAVSEDVAAFLLGCDTEQDRLLVDKLAFDMVASFFQLRLRWVESLFISLSLPQPVASIETEAA